MSKRQGASFRLLGLAFCFLARLFVRSCNCSEPVKRSQSKRDGEDDVHPPLAGHDKAPILAIVKVKVEYSHAE